MALQATATEEPFLHFSHSGYENWTYHRDGINMDQNFISQGRVNLMVTSAGELVSLESPVFSGQGIDSIKVFVDYRPHIPYVAAKVALQVDIIDAMGNILSTITQDIAPNVMQQDVNVMLAVPTDGNCSLLLSAPKADTNNCAAVYEVKVWSCTTDEPIQTFDYFEFVDKDGNVVSNGATLTLTELTTETDVFTGEASNIMYSHLKLRNKTATERYLRINMTIERIDNGMYLLCFPLVCKSYTEATNVVTAGYEMMANELKDLQTEWLPDGVGVCDVTLTVEILKVTGSITDPGTYLADGPTVTLHYRNGNTDSVSGDINGDGVVDILDINAVINNMLGDDTEIAADINNDGVVDIFDVNEVVNAMLGKN